jgi:hypothetical protein
MREGECLVPVQKNGWTALHAASRNGHLAVVGALLAKGADVHTKDEVRASRAPAPSVHLAHSRACRIRIASGNLHLCIPLLLSLKTAPPSLLQGVSAIASMRGNALGSVRLWPTARHSPQYVATVTSRVKILVLTAVRHTFSPRLPRCVMLNRYCYLRWPPA